MRKYLIIILSVWLCLTVSAQTEPLVADTLAADTLVTDLLPWPHRLTVQVDSALTMSPMLQTSQLGLYIYDLTADSALYRHGYRQTLRPASTMKLVTAITALEQLPADYRLKTSLYYSGTIGNGTLRGNLYVVGGMDPMFDTVDMNYFVNHIRHLGIDTICGNILADRSFKDSDLLGEGWCWDDDNPPLSPLLIDRKDEFIERLERALERDSVVLGDVSGVQRLAFNAQRSTLICSRSHTVDELLVDMMKDSDNLYAEALFYHLAANAGARPAKGKVAANQVKKMIQKVGLRPGDYKIADGSGLSLYNYVSPELQVRLLRYIWKRPQLFDRLVDTLPIASVDGTLKSRMTKGAAAGNIHAKTGTVSGISSLAGYCTASNGHVLCFSIINQGVMRIADGRAMQDQICEIMCK